MRIYVASSWRNHVQPAVVDRLRGEGHEVYDFRNPCQGDHGFHWSQIDPNWNNWSPEQFRNALQHQIAERGFGKDMNALIDAEATVLVLPCGRSAHLELGYAVAGGQFTYILSTEPTEPELMYKMCDGICLTLDELVESIGGLGQAQERRAAPR